MNNQKLIDYCVAKGMHSGRDKVPVRPMPSSVRVTDAPRRALATGPKTFSPRSAAAILAAGRRKTTDPFVAGLPASAY